MNKELVFKGSDDQLLTSSIIVAETFGKRHADVIRSINNLECSCPFRERNFALMFTSKQLPNDGSREDVSYAITRDGFTLLAMGYTGKKAMEFKEAYIDAFNRMDNELKGNKPVAYIEDLISDPAFGIKMLTALQNERNENARLQIESDEMKKEVEVLQPKGAYYDNVLQSTDTYTIEQIAKEIGMSAVSLNKRLEALRIQYKRSGQWMLMSDYHSRGYTKSRTHYFNKADGTCGTKMYMVWTERGRKFIHAYIKN